MERKKVLTLIWRRTNPMELGKDVVLLPYYLGRALDYRTEILCGYPDEIEQRVRAEEKEDFKFVRRWITYNPLQRILIYSKYLFQNSSRIDLLMCFHWRFETFAVILLHRLFNRKGQIYVKLDTATGIEWDLSYRNFVGKFIRKRLYRLCLKKVDLFSCETMAGYRNLCGNKDFGKALQERLVLMPNAFDESQFERLGISERNHRQKENLIITVGRLGTEQKNTEMQLEALAGMDLDGWKFCFIGPIEKKFQSYIDGFFHKYPEKKNQVEFVGPVYDKKLLWEYYNRAKVFVCTSRWESSGIVLNEAKRFRNYIVTTRVGEAEDLVEQEKYGAFVPQEDAAQLGEILSQIVSGVRETDVYQGYDVRRLSYQSRVKVLSDFLSQTYK